MSLWLQQHATVAKFLQSFAAFAAAFAFVNEAAIVAALPVWAAPIVGALILAAHEWFSGNYTISAKKK